MKSLIGNDSGPGIFPGRGESSKPTRLTLQRSVTVKGDATYTYKLYMKKATADPVIVNRVTIESVSKVRTDPCGAACFKSEDRPLFGLDAF